MTIPKHKVFISYHHLNDQGYKESILEWNRNNEIFIDASVDTGDINENLPDDTIRQKIRDEYLKDSSVTILLVGTDTKKRKHIDWEIYSSMYDGQVNKKSGILVINLPRITVPTGQMIITGMAIPEITEKANGLGNTSIHNSMKMWTTIPRP